MQRRFIRMIGNGTALNGILRQRAKQKAENQYDGDTCFAPIHDRFLQESLIFSDDVSSPDCSLRRTKHPMLPPRCTLIMSSVANLLAKPICAYSSISPCGQRRVAQCACERKHFRKNGQEKRIEKIAQIRKGIHITIVKTMKKVLIKRDIIV